MAAGPLTLQGQYRCYAKGGESLQRHCQKHCNGCTPSLQVPTGSQACCTPVRKQQAAQRAAAACPCMSIEERETAGQGGGWARIAGAEQQAEGRSPALPPSQPPPPLPGLRSCALRHGSAGVNAHLLRVTHTTGPPHAHRHSHRPDRHMVQQTWLCQAQQTSCDSHFVDQHQTQKHGKFLQAVHKATSPRHPQHEGGNQPRSQAHCTIVSRQSRLP